MERTQAKAWCFTWNNYTPEDIELLERVYADHGTYLVYGKEVGEQGTKHLQGFIYFTKRKTFRFVQKAFQSKVHLERAKGSPAQAADYCKKDGDFVERGECPVGKGQRNDLREVYESIKDGKSLRDIADTNPNAAIRYSSGILRLQQFFRPKRESAPTIWTFHGPTGSGKTRRVWEFGNAEHIWIHPGQSWFDGYMGQSAALFDDFDGGWFKISYLLKLLDRYVFPVPVKGGYTWWCPKTIFITSNMAPPEWYPNANEEHRRALMRRLTEYGTIVPTG